MIQQGKIAAQARDSSSPRSVMDVKSAVFMQPTPVFPAHRQESPLEGNPSFYTRSKENSFADTYPDPLCNLNLKETSDFVKAFPLPRTSSTNSRALLPNNCAQRRREGGNGTVQRRLEGPSTPGRPVFSFTVGNLPRKGFPSKWDDAEKWLISSGSCHESPAHLLKSQEPSKIMKQSEAFQHKVDVFSEKMRVADEKATILNGPLSLESSNLAFHGVSAEVLLKDKFTDNVEPILPNYRYSESTKEGFFFGSSICDAMKDAATEVVSEVRHRDIGTEMTPLGSLTTSRCHTPFKSSSPARHNTPANRSGPLAGPNASVDISELQDCHFAKLQIGSQFDSVTSNWSSREEEEEEVSKSLRHFEMGRGGGGDGGGCRKSTSAESRASVWEDEEKTKCCIRYQREEAKIQAWVNLQSAKAEAQSRKLEVKIEKMRSNLAQKLMKRMAFVHRRAEECRASAQQQHSQHLQKVSHQAHKMKSGPSCSAYSATCGCFPCNTPL